MVSLHTRRRALIARLLFGVVLLFATTAVEAACKEDALANVQGATLVMTSGAVYQLENSVMDVALWFPPTRVMVCERISMNGIPYYAISNKDTNKTVSAARVVD
jgi:hypothetical protein